MAAVDTSSVDIHFVEQYNATITPTGPFCDMDSPVTLIAVSEKGLWSGIGITDSVNPHCS